MLYMSSIDWHYRSTPTSLSEFKLLSELATHETSELAIKNFGLKGNGLKLKPHALKVLHLKLSSSLQKRKSKQPLENNHLKLC